MGGYYLHQEKYICSKLVHTIFDHALLTFIATRQPFCEANKAMTSFLSLIFHEFDQFFCLHNTDIPMRWKDEKSEIEMSHQSACDHHVSAYHNSYRQRLVA